jgi:hypothetical protein
MPKINKNFDNIREKKQLNCRVFVCDRTSVMFSLKWRVGLILNVPTIVKQREYFLLCVQE